jgi:Na+/H+ antiporter NhaD/arsenite permease-like protein
MIFADYANYGFNDFFVYHGKLSIFFAVQVGMIVGALFFYGFFARKGGEKVEVERERVLTWVPTVLLVLMILGLALASFVWGGISLASGLIVMALGLIGIFWYRFAQKAEGKKVLELVKGLDWDTVFFLIGIFVVVGAIGEAGLLDDAADVLDNLVGDSVFLGFLLIVGFSTLISGFVDNVPYIIAMLPVAARMAATHGIDPKLYMFSLLVGSCMGGNLTPFGASANVVSVGILRKQGRETNFAQWLKIGLPFTLLTTFFASAFVWLVWR